MYNMFERVINRWVMGYEDLVMRFRSRVSIYSEVVSSNKCVFRFSHFVPCFDLHL